MLQKVHAELIHRNCRVALAHRLTTVETQTPFVCKHNEYREIQQETEVEPRRRRFGSEHVGRISNDGVPARTRTVHIFDFQATRRDEERRVSRITAKNDLWRTRAFGEPKAVSVVRARRS